jgi:hypothetical protein
LIRHSCAQPVSVPELHDERRYTMLQSNALVVDASISMRNYVREILHQELGFNEVHEAEDADDAFEY